MNMDVCKEKMFRQKTFDKIIDMVKNNEITIKESIAKLNQLDELSNIDYRSQSNRIVNKLSLTYNDISFSDSPEEILLEKEKRAERMAFACIVRSELTSQEYKLLLDSTKMSQREIGEKLGIDHKTVVYRLNKIRKKVIDSIRDKFKQDPDNYSQLFNQIPTLHTPKRPMGMGQPYEAEMKLPLGLRWQGAYGNERNWKKEECKIPEYIKPSKIDSICNICEQRCTRKESFPPYSNPLPQWKRDIINRIIAENTI